MRIAKWLIITALTATAACTQQQSESASHQAQPAPAAKPQLTALANTRQIMLGMTAPTSDVIFQIAEKAPADDAEWEKVQASAMSLAESANLLKVDGRRIDTPDFLQFVDQLILHSQEAAQAAQEKNVDKVMAAGDQIYEVCDACHKKYLAARGGV